MDTDLYVQALGGAALTSAIGLFMFFNRSKASIFRKVTVLETEFTLFKKTNESQFELLCKKFEKLEESMENRFNKLEESAENRFNKLEESTENRFKQLEDSTEKRSKQLEESTENRFKKFEETINLQLNLKLKEMELKNSKELKDFSKEIEDRTIYKLNGLEQRINIQLYQILGQISEVRSALLNVNTPLTKSVQLDKSQSETLKSDK